MPIPLVKTDEREQISAELRRSAGLVDRITAVDNPVRDFNELEAIRRAFKGVGDVLHAGVTAQHFTREQIISLASGLEAVGAELRKAAGPAARKKASPSPRKKASQPPRKKKKT